MHVRGRGDDVHVRGRGDDVHVRGSYDTTIHVHVLREYAFSCNLCVCVRVCVCVCVWGGGLTEMTGGGVEKR